MHKLDNPNCVLKMTLCNALQHSPLCTFRCEFFNSKTEHILFCLFCFSLFSFKILNGFHLSQWQWSVSSEWIFKEVSWKRNPNYDRSLLRCRCDSTTWANFWDTNNTNYVDKFFVAIFRGGLGKHELWDYAKNIPAITSIVLHFSAVYIGPDFFTIFNQIQEQISDGISSSRSVLIWLQWESGRIEGCLGFHRAFWIALNNTTIHMGLWTNLEFLAVVTLHTTTNHKPLHQVFATDSDFTLKYSTLWLVYGTCRQHCVRWLPYKMNFTLTGVNVKKIFKKKTMPGCWLQCCVQNNLLKCNS